MMLFKWLRHKIVMFSFRIQNAFVMLRHRIGYIRALGLFAGNKAYVIFRRMERNPDEIIKYRSWIVAKSAVERDQDQIWVLNHWARYLDKWHQNLTGQITILEYNEFMKTHLHELSLRKQETLG